MNVENRLGIDNKHNGDMPKPHCLTPVEKQSVIDCACTHITSSTYYLRDGFRRIAYMGPDKINLPYRLHRYIEY